MKSMTLTAPDEDYAKSEPGFLHQHPNTEKDKEDKLVRTDDEHVAKCLSDYYNREAEWGLKKIAGETITLDKVFSIGE